VAILDRENSDGKAVAEGLGAPFYPVDVTDFAGTEAALQSAVDELGGLHVTVTTRRRHRQADLDQNRPHDLESFQSVIDLNLIATFNISRLAPRTWPRTSPKTRSAASSSTPLIAAFEGQIGQVAYTAPRRDRGMCLTMARDLVRSGSGCWPSRRACSPRVDQGIPDEFAAALTKGRSFPQAPWPARGVRQAGRAIVDNPMLNGQCLRLDAGQRFAPK